MICPCSYPTKTGRLKRMTNPFGSKMTKSTSWIWSPKRYLPNDFYLILGNPKGVLNSGALLHNFLVLRE